MNSNLINTNLSNKFQNEQLHDPINYKINIINRSLNSQSDTIPERYTLKSRIIKERDSLGGFKISQDSLKKHINPSDEYEAKLRILQEAKEKLYQMDHSLPIDNSALNYNSIIAQSASFDPNAPTGESLIKMIEMQVKQLKQESDYHLQGLDKKGGLGVIKEENDGMNGIDANNNGVIEKHVANKFLSANEDRVQVIKHVITQLKPEYMSLEQLQKEKDANTIKLLELEQRYKEIKTTNPMQEIIDEECRNNPFKKPGITLEELTAILKHEDDLFHFEAKLRNKKQKKKIIANDTKEQTSNLNKKEDKYVKKLAKYIVEKKINDGNLENNQSNDWNKTRIYSKNINGVVYRKDGLPGHFDNKDLQLYYCDITNGDNSNVDGFTKAKKRTMRRSFNNSYIYNDKDALNVSAAQLTRTRNVLYSPKDTQRSPMMINMIYDLIDKEKIGLVSKDKIVNEMQFDDKTMKDLGFASKVNFEEMLNEFNTEYDGKITQEEFANFLNKGINDKKNTKRQSKSQTRGSRQLRQTKQAMTTNSIIYNDNREQEEPLFYESNNYTRLNPDLEYEPKLNEFLNTSNNPYKYTNKSFNDNNNNNNNDDDDFLPVFHLRDILKNTSNIKRLQLLKQSLKSTPSQSQSNAPRSKSARKPNTKSTRIPVTYDDYKQVLNKYNQKDNINFTIPKPFRTQQKGPSHNSIQRMHNLLQERQDEEDNIFINQRFKAKNLKNEMFIGNIDKVIESDKKERIKRTKKLADKLQDSLNPFSFVDKDQKTYLEKVNKKHVVMQYPQFKANSVYWKTKVNLLDKINEKETRERKERIQLHAKETLINSKLPPRLEQYEKDKEEKRKMLNEIKIKDGQPKGVKNKKMPTIPITTMIKTLNGVDIPDFDKLHERNEAKLLKMKQKIKPTVIKPFNLHETHLKIKGDNDAYDDDNPSFKKNIHSMIYKINHKEVNEPASSAGQKMLIEAKRIEQEKNRKDEEMRKVDDAQRKNNHAKIKDRVQKSDALNETKMNRKKKGMMDISRINQDKENERNTYMIIAKQKILNRPLMFENRNDINALIKRQEMRKIIEDAMQEEDNEEALQDNDRLDDNEEERDERKNVEDNDEYEDKDNEELHKTQGRYEQQEDEEQQNNNEEEEQQNNEEEQQNNEEEQFNNKKEQQYNEEEQQYNEEEQQYNEEEQQYNEEEQQYNEEEQQNNEEEQQNNEEEQQNNEEEQQNNEEEQQNNEEEQQNNEEEKEIVVYDDKQDNEKEEANKESNLENNQIEENYDEEQFLNNDDINNNSYT